MLQAVTGVFTEVGTWISTALTDMMDVFYTGESLTLLGVLAVAGLAFSVIFLVLNMIKSFLRFQ